MNEGIWLEICCLWSDAFLLHFLDTVKTRKVKKSLVTFWMPLSLRHEGTVTASRGDCNCVTWGMKIRPDADNATSGRTENCVGT